MDFEKKKQEQVSMLAEDYTKQFPEHMKTLEKSPLARVRSLTETDICNLGQILRSFTDYKQMCEEDGTIAHLGTMPKVALDSLTANFGASPINVLASVQPIDEVQGIVYFRDFVAQNTRGNVVSGNSLISTLGLPDAFPKGFTTDDFQTSVVLDGPGGAGTDSYTNVPIGSGNDYPGPINPQKVVLSGQVVFAGGTAVFANVVPDPVTGNFSQMVDVGGGTFVGMHGTVDFAGCKLASLDFTAVPSAGANKVKIWVSYQSIPEGNSDLQKAILKLQTKPINARFFALKGTFGMQEAYMLKKRLNVSLADEIARDLTVTINNEISNTAIDILLNNVPNGASVSWSRKPADGTSYFEHKMTILDALADMDAKMVSKAGRGSVNCLMVGRIAAAIISTLPGFVKVFDDNSFGPHIYGTLNGITVVRVPYSAIMDEKTVIGIFKGAGNFEAPLVYSPYMPLVSTDVLPMALNPLQNQRAVAIWAGLDPLITNFIVKLTIDDTNFAY